MYVAFSSFQESGNFIWCHDDSPVLKVNRLNAAAHLVHPSGMIFMQLLHCLLVSRLCARGLLDLMRLRMTKFISGDHTGSTWQAWGASRGQ